MFYDPVTEKLYDYVGGEKDLRARLIRAIGDPHERIREDRLRMIRGIRLACRFHFEIEKKTEEAIRAHAGELFPSVAIERVVQEFEKAHLFDNLPGMLAMLHDYHLLSSIFPELASVSMQELFDRLQPLKSYPRDAPLIAFLLPLFPSFTLDNQLDLAKKLKISNTDQQFIAYLFHAHELMSRDHVENVEWAHLYAHHFWKNALAIEAAHLPPEEETSFTTAHEKRLLALQPAINRIEQRTPVVTSDDLKKAGIKPGKMMGNLLKEAERISCNEKIYQPGPIIKRLQQSGLWP
jgi:poly(A) polymerase